MIYRFGEFELDDSSFELRRAGGPVALEPKALEVLLFLVRFRERSVSKAELLDAVWSDVIVGESTLTRIISLARRAVGDSATEQSTIRTHARCGYRFVAAVSLSGAHASSGREPTTTPTTAPRTAETTNSNAYRWHMRGLELLRRANVGNLTRGLDAFDRAIELDSKYASAYVGHARANAALASYGVGSAASRYRDMKRKLRHALTVDPRNSAAHRELGSLHMRLGEPARAQTEFEKALELDPDNPEYQDACGNPLETLRRPRETTELMLERRWRDPLDLNGAGIYAMALAEEGRVDEAVAELKTLIELDPSYSESYGLLGTIESYMRNRQASGIQCTMKAFELDPRNPDTTLEAFMISIDLGDMASAERWLQITESNSEEGSSGDRAKYALAYYRGDVAGARAISLKLINTYEREYIWDTDLAEFLFLRELQATEPDLAMQFYTQRYPELLENPPQVNSSNPAAAISLAEWLQRWGDQKAADLLLEMALSVIREARGFWFLEGTVTAHLLRGETLRALTAFHDAIDAGWRIPWCLRKSETKYSKLRSHPRFRSAIAKVEAELTAEFTHIREMGLGGERRLEEIIASS